jgi:hypothetical protein
MSKTDIDVKDLVNKVRCERKIGQFSKELPVNITGRPSKKSSHNGKTFDTKTEVLKDAGIAHYKRYEAIAEMPK